MQPEVAGQLPGCFESKSRVEFQLVEPNFLPRASFLLKVCLCAVVCVYFRREGNGEIGVFEFSREIGKTVVG